MARNFLIAGSVLVKCFHLRTPICRSFLSYRNSSEGVLRRPLKSGLKVKYLNRRSTRLANTGLLQKREGGRGREILCRLAILRYGQSMRVHCRRRRAVPVYCVYTDGRRAVIASIGVWRATIAGRASQLARSGCGPVSHALSLLSGVGSSDGTSQMLTHSRRILWQTTSPYILL